MTAAPPRAPLEVLVTQARSSDEWVVTCITGSCTHRGPIGAYEELASAKVAAANHRRWHVEQLARGAACPTCGQLVAPLLRTLAGLPDLPPPALDDVHPQFRGLTPLPFGEPDDPQEDP